MIRSMLAVAASGLCLAAAVHAQEEGALPDALTAGWQGKPVCEQLHETATSRVLRCTFPPGIGHERHYHPAHFGYALSGGQMRVTNAQGTRVAEIRAGTNFASKGFAWHEVLNVGTSTVQYLIVEERPAPR